MAQLLIQNLVSLIDNFMVAGLGDIKMSSVNIAGQINFVFMVFINTVCSSGGIFMSQYKGAKDKDGMQQTFRFKFVVGFASGILYTIFCLFYSKPVLALMVRGNSQAAEIVAESVKYMRLAAFSWLPMCMASIIASSLREIGKVKPPLVLSIIATLVNTFFNWVLIYGNLGFARLEVRGAAIATIIARVVEMILYIVYIRRTKPEFYSRIRDLLKVRLNLFVSIMKKCGVILISEMTWVLSETITTALYNSRGGAEIVSGMAASFAIANLFFISFNGVYTSTGVIIGTTLGANKLDEARKQKNWLFSGAIVFGIFFGLLGYLSSFLIPIVFSNLSEPARVVTKNMVYVMAIYMPVWCFVNCQFAVSRTGGDTMMGVCVDVSTNLLLVIPGMIVMTYLTAFGPVLMYTVIKSVDIVKVIIAWVWLKKERWVKNLTI